MAGPLPRLRWVIIGPVVLTGVVLGIGVAILPHSATTMELLRTGVRTFFAISFLVIGVGLTVRLLLDGFGDPAGD